MNRVLGQWNYYVESGRTQGERRERLNEVPAELRQQVESHVRTVFKIKRFFLDSRDRRIGG